MWCDAVRCDAMRCGAVRCDGYRKTPEDCGEKFVGEGEDGERRTGMVEYKQVTY